MKGLPNIESVTSLRDKGLVQIADYVAQLGHGLSHDLSFILHKNTGLPIVRFSDDLGINVHSGVYITDEIVFDAYGFCTVDEVKDRYSSLITRNEFVVEKVLDTDLKNWSVSNAAYIEVLEAYSLVMNHLGVTFTSIRDTSEILSGVGCE